MASPNAYKASLGLAKVHGSLTGKEEGDVIIHANFKFTLVTAANETPDTCQAQTIIMDGMNGLHKRFKDHVGSQEWPGYLHIEATTGLENIYQTMIRVEHGRGSSTMQEPGDLFMSVDHKLRVVTAIGDSPETHREQVVGVVDELYRCLKEGAKAPDFWIQQQKDNTI